MFLNKKSFLILLLLLFCLRGLVPFKVTAQNEQSIRSICEHVRADKSSRAFYQNRNSKPVWVTPSGLSSLGLELLDSLTNAGAHGLCPNDYHLGCIQKGIKSIDHRINTGQNIEKHELDRLNLIMTDAFLKFGAHLATGKMDPKRVFPQRSLSNDRIDIFDTINSFCLKTVGVKEALKFLAPSHPEYWEMLESAEWLKTIQAAGGWPFIPRGRLLRAGDVSSRIIPLRHRLEMDGYLSDGPCDDNRVFDDNLMMAVKEFQANHGLVVDGIAGPETLEALNVPAKKRRRQILVNLERWRWLPRSLGERHIRVNIAAFTLDAVDKGKTLSMRVIVGKNYQKTPLCSKEMAYIKFNPYWNVPWSIVKEELLPKFKKDPDYMNKNHYELVDGWNPESPVIDSGDIRWESVNATNFPGRIRQLPGPWNALGQVKFMFPNQFNVYLHDTSSNSKHLFKKVDRALSHGCIRVEKPVELAVFLLREKPEWTRKRIKSVIENGEQCAVPVASGFMIHLLYYTAWLDAEGKINYRKDIYGRDEILWKALQQGPATKTTVKRVSNPFPCG